MSDLLARLGGANLEVLQQVRSAKNRFVQMGCILLTTASLAVVSMSFALHDGVKVSWPWAVPVGLLWGVMILNIDRFLMMSMASSRRLRDLIVIALPRFAMAAVLSLAVSTPLVLRIFSSDIKAQIYSTQLARSASQSAQLANSTEAKEAAAVATQISGYQAILDGQLPTSATSPAFLQAQQQVAALTTQKQQAQLARDTAYEAWQCELYGAGATCQGSSNRQGNGPLAGAKQREYEEAQANLQSVSNQLQQAQKAEATAQAQSNSAQAGALAAAQRNARTELAAAQKRYTALESEIQRISDEGTSLNFGDTGELAQLTALSDLSSQNGTVMGAHIVVLLLFFIIEILPVTVKLLLNLQPKTLYDEIAEAADEEQRVKSQSHQLLQRQIEEGMEKNRLKQEEDMRKREREMGKIANEHVAKEMTSILDRALQEWSTQVHAQLASSGGQGPARAAAPRRASSSPIIDRRPGFPKLRDPDNL